MVRGQAGGVRGAVSDPLRGRDVELALLDDQLARLRGGSGTGWLVEGGPGLGKSRLVEQAMSAARAGGFAVGHGVAGPGDAAVELGVLMEALFGGAEPLFERSALAGSRVSGEQRYWLLQDIQALLEQAALRQPVLICLDDLQWADGGTRAAIRALPARLASLPVGWVLAFRPVEAGSDLGRAAAELAGNGADLTVLGRLDQAAVAEVIADVLGAVPDGSLLTLAEGMQGNPFFLMELLAGLREEHLVSFDAGHATLSEARLPLRVREGMRRRLARMSPVARNAAAVAASLGRRFTVGQLAAVLQVPASSLLDAVQELIGYELLAEDRDMLGFSHDLNREAVRASQPSSAVQALDRQVASALLAAGALPVEVATQMAASAMPGDELAITTLMKASDTLAGTDPGQAADLARRGLDLTTEHHPLRGPLVARTAILLNAAARTAEAQDFTDSALRQTLPAAQEAEVRLAIASLITISPEVRAKSCRQALDLPGVPPDLQARLHVLHFYTLIAAGRPDEAERRLEEVRRAVEDTGDITARFSLELAESALQYTRGHFEAALALIEKSVRNGGVGEDARKWLDPWGCRMLAVMDRFDEAFAAATEGIRAAQRARQGRTLQLFENNRARQLLQLGQLGDVAAALEGRFSPGDAHLLLSPMDADAMVVLGRIALHTGDNQQIRLTSAIARVMLKSGVPSIERHAAWLLALHAQAAGDPAQSRRWLTALGEKERLSLFPLFPVDPADDPHLVRIALASGDQELAESTAASAERRAEINPTVPVMQASAAHSRGLLTGDPVLLAQAVTSLQTGQRRLAQASAMEDLAIAQLRADRPGQAITALDRALDIYAACGARWDLARVRRRLRQLGVRRRLAAQRRPTHGWAALTESELAVVRLVSEGLTNRAAAERLYVSPHTVNGHLRHAFEKLGVSSRVDLTRIAAQHPKPAKESSALPRPGAAEHQFIRGSPLRRVRMTGHPCTTSGGTPFVARWSTISAGPVTSDAHVPPIPMLPTR